MRNVLFVVKYSAKGEEVSAGLFEDFETAKARVAELVETEADYAWVEVGGYPELRTESKYCGRVKELEPAEEPKPKRKSKSL